MKKHSRAQRRHDRERLKKNRRNHWGYGKQGWRSYCEHGTKEMPADVAGMVVNTPTPCSCPMCGNPRRNYWANTYERRTIQERKAIDSYIDGIDEFEDLYTYRWEKYDSFWEWEEDYSYDILMDSVDWWYLKWMYVKTTG